MLKLAGISISVIERLARSNKTFKSDAVESRESSMEIPESTDIHL